MRLLVVGPEPLAEELRAAMPGAEVARVAAGVAATARADAVVVALAEATRFLDRAPRPLPSPVVWSVPRTADRETLRRLTEAGPSQILFEGGASDVARAVAALRPVPTDRAPGDAPTASPMAALWERFRPTMIERLEVLERVGAELLEESVGDGSLREAHEAAHKLHGSLGTFGLARGSELAAAVERILEGPPLDAGDVYRYSELVVGLRREIEGGRPDPGRRSAGPAAGPTTPGPAPSGATGILIVEPDPARGESLSAAAAARGWSPRLVAGADEAIALAGNWTPRLALLDPAAGTAASLDRLLEMLADASSPVPVLYRVRGRAFDERLRAVSRGARAFVDADATAEAVMARAALLLNEEELEEATVLVVDDDAAVLRAVTFLLRGAGLRVHPLADPLAFWETLESTAPDLLLLDIELPGVSGLQLCRVTRADPRWSQLPILLLTARSDAGSLSAGFEAGADDYIVKPVVGPELVARVEGRLGRGARGQGGSVDPETGLPRRAGTLDRLGIQLALAARYGEAVAGAVVRVEPAQEGAAGSLARIAEAIRKAARPEDVVGRWSDHELLVARYGQAPDRAARWIDAVLKREGIDGSPDGPFLGTAGYPDVEGAEALATSAADAAQRRAQVTPRITGGAGAPVSSAPVSGAAGAAASGAGSAGAPGRVDIVVVEDDEALGTLLVRTLDDRGYTTRWIRDGAEAVAVLGGARPSLRASLVILDVGLPGLDGLSLLRQLGRDGVTRGTRVLMLTARSAESEVVKALELGAYDHVPKPFSVSELLHRVRRALGERGDDP